LEIEYLGHVIGKVFVRVYPKKIKAMDCKFVENYGKIAMHFTALLKNNSFTWTPTADRAFQALKVAMFTTSVLALPDFTKNFFLECDSFGRGLRVVLMQYGLPLAFTIKQPFKMIFGPINL
jgi:hypothetical protein